MISKKYLLSIILLIAIVSVIVVYQLMNSNILSQNTLQSGEGAIQAGSSLTQTSPFNPKIPVPERNNTSGVNEKKNKNETGGGGGNTGGPPGGMQTSGSSGNETSKGPISLDGLKIFSICSADVNSSLQVFEGEPCYVSAPPYYMIFSKNATSIQTSFYDNQGYNGTYDVNDSNDDSTIVFKIFLQNLMLIGTTDVTLQISGDIAPYLRTGDITITDVYAEQPDIHQIQKNPVVITRIVSIPVYLKNNIPFSTSWQKASFYLNTENDTYFLGDVWSYVTVL